MIMPGSNSSSSGVFSNKHVANHMSQPWMNVLAQHKQTHMQHCLNCQRRHAW
jgi:hypothetical protein